MAEVDITVVEDTENDNGYDWLSGALTAGEIDAESVEDMVDKILEKLGDDDCIRSLTIIGHGSPGNISVGDGQGHEEGGHMATWNQDEWKDQIDRLQGRFCEDAVVTLRGCNTGAEEDGANLLALLADCLDVTVRAPTGTCNALWAGGEWVTATPGSPPEPKPSADAKKKKESKDADKKLNEKVTKTAMFFRAGDRFVALAPADVAAITFTRTGVTDGNVEVVELSEKQTRFVLSGLDVSEAVNILGYGYDILGYLSFRPKSGHNPELLEMAPTPVVAGHGIIVPAGDWCMSYRLSEAAEEVLAKL